MKKEPESIADLRRMIDTSDGWFDGVIKHTRLLGADEENEVGTATSEEVQVRTGYCCDSMSVRCIRWVTSEVRSVGYSSSVEEVWNKPMTFEEFRESEWWQLAMEKFKGGSCDVSEIFVKTVEADEGPGPRSRVYVEAQCERHYKDWLGNARLAKGFDEVGFWLYGNGEAGFRINGEDYEFDIVDLAGMIEKAKAFDDAGVSLENGKLTVELAAEDERGD